ncbi:LacI family DNA-binding transcriptional regulator [Saccharibacillus alkalitolerans]|uniref:LacI family transcriptional regulator n=1 Tax=Saccharibacillus alkalitolerans TaxID=2705290 RepID=A0ABX0F4V5_9BACL|nr:LacI family DNA-binding transcriptional regulator [Saccharibacillus alkalitolerans]NGZ74594.1 LacI family transcriptional regulator [Saccharibacillus alkalitolerans]
MDSKIKDVARAAGVSPTSVSRVLNNSPHVSEKLEKKVRQAIEQLNYTPSMIAKNLKRNKTNLIGVIIADVTSGYQASVLSGIEEECASNGYHLLVSNIKENTRKVLDYLYVFQEMRVDGIVLMHGKMTEEIRNFIKRTNIPIVAHADVGFDLPAVIIDNFQAAYDAVEYLIRRGHRRIAMLAGDMRDISEGQRRYDGYAAACERYGLTADESLVRCGDYKLDTGYRLAEELLADRGGAFTALFAASDDMAVGAINCFHDRGLRVPDDISVIGIDGGPLSDIVRPRLTAIHQPVDRITRAITDLLFERIGQGKDSRQDDQSGSILYIPHRLVEKESCKDC